MASPTALSQNIPGWDQLRQTFPKCYHGSRLFFSTKGRAWDVFILLMNAYTYNNDHTYIHVAYWNVQCFGRMYACFALCAAVQYISSM